MNINAISNDMEKYMASMIGNHLTFIDSFQFKSSGLDKLVDNLPKEAFKYTAEQCEFCNQNSQFGKNVLYSAKILCLQQ